MFRNVQSTIYVYCVRKKFVYNNLINFQLNEIKIVTDLLYLLRQICIEVSKVQL